MKKSKKNERIFLLPQFPADAPVEEFRDFFMKNWELAATLDYVPTSLEELKRIDYIDLKIVMEQNERFYNAAVSLGTDAIASLIGIAKKLVAEDEIECSPLDHVQTLEDLLNSGYYGEDYDSSRTEFITCFAEYICD